MGSSWAPEGASGAGKPEKPKAALMQVLLLWAAAGTRMPSWAASSRLSLPWEVSLYHRHLPCGGFIPGLWVPHISGLPDLGKAS